MPNDAPLHLVDAELLAGLDVMPQLTLSLEGLPQIRGLMDQMSKMATAATPAPQTPVEAEERFVPGPAGAPEVRVLTYRPTGVKTPMPAYLHIHGGGYVMGAPEMSAALNTLIAAELGCFVVSVDYRLAPDTPFPGPIEDCYAALKWLHGDAEALGLDTGRIAIGGESAGGGLAAALALVARDRGEVPIRFQCLTYPMIDDRTVTRTDQNPYVGHHLWTPDGNRFGWTALLGREPGGEGVSPYAAASRAEDLSGLAPALIIVGALDLFLEENLEYARRLLRAGVPTELHVYPGAYHGFELSPDAQVTKAAVRDRMAALGRALG
jgi:acetyl esterase/lipase